MSEELPPGWLEVTLQNVGVWRSGGTPSRRRPEFFGKGIPWVKSGDLPDGPILKTDEEITKLGLENSAAKLMPAGTISMALYGATIGKLGLMTFPAATNQACANVVPDTRLVEPSFLFNYLLSERRNFIEQGQGGAQPNISQEIVRSHRFPLAPLAEQRRIVAKLEKLLGQVDACQQRLAKLPTLLRRFRQSVLAAACSGRLTADWREEYNFSFEKNWRDAELRDICSSITDGDHLPPPKQTSGIPFLTIGNISSGGLDFSETRFVSESYFAKIKHDRVPNRGDTLYTVVGATIGIPVLVDTDRQFCFQRHIAILKPSPEASPKYLCMLMESPAVFREAWARITGSAQPTLPLGNLRTIPVILPTLAEQQEIVRRVGGLFALADQLKLRLAQARGQVDKLTPSLPAPLPANWCRRTQTMNRQRHCWSASRHERDEMLPEALLTEYADEFFELCYPTSAYGIR